MTTKRLIRISYFTMLTIIGGLLRLPIPAFPNVMFSLQTLFVIMSGLILGPKDALISQFAYMLLGLIGVPVFTAGGGLDYVFKPSFGYILSFPFAAFLTGSLKNRFRTLSVFKLFFCAFCGLLLNYTVGMTYQVFAVWLFVKSTLAAAFVSLTTLPFLFIKDAVMLYLVCLIYPRVTPLIGIESPPFEKKDNGEIAV